LCREDGKAISDLAAQASKPLEGFGVFGVVKETGVDDEGLSSFKKEYFDFPLYRDDEYDFYGALGGRRVKMSSLFGMLFSGNSLRNRWKEKNITGANMVGEGIKQGGVIVFGKDGKQRYAYEEITGTVVPTDDLVAAVNAVKEEQR